MSRFASIAFIVVCLLFGANRASAAATIPCSNPVMGTSCTFNAYDYTDSTAKEISLSATCRKVSEHLFIFVEDGVLGEGLIGATQLNALVSAFETATPRTTELGKLGIFSALTLSLGALPNQFDNAPQLYLVLTHIASPVGKPVTAYFRPVDEEKSEFGQPATGSNQHEIIFLEATNVDSDRRLADLTREVVNLIHWGADAKEDEWVRAALAYSAPIWLGYTAYTDEINAFAETPNTPLLGETIAQSTKIDYGAAALFGLYVRDHLPQEFLFNWLADSHQGISGFESALAATGITNKSFCDYLHGFVVQNGLNRGEYRYSLITLPSIGHSIIRQHPGALNVPSIAYGGVYVDIDAKGASAGSRLEVSYQPPQGASVLLTVVRTSSKNSNFFEVKEQSVLSSGPTIMSYDDIAEGPDKISLLTSRCTPGPQQTIAITTQIIAPQIDGDADTAETESEAETSEDGDTDTDGDSTEADTSERTEAESDEDILIVGEMNCHEVNACVSVCPDTACQANCVAQGTLTAQSEWQDFRTCINGYNPSYDNCMNPSKTTYERENCIHVNCPNQLAACSVPTEPITIKKTVSACKSAEPLSAAPLFGALALLLLWRRRRLTR